ncbi:MAG: HAMP domain-containing sensor histidine kinase, partial [Chloroflexota bacterium]
SLVLTACELTSSEAASVLRCDSADGQLHFVAAPRAQRDLLRVALVPLDGSAAGWAFRHASPLVIQDARRDRRHFKAVDQLTGIATRSLLAVPLVFRGEALGVMEAVNKIGDAHYTEDDVIILETLASVAASALREHDLSRRVESHQSERAELDRLKSDFIAITSHELRTPLGLILGHSTFLRELVDERFHEQLDIIIRNATRLKEIVENLSNVDNYQSGAARVRERVVAMNNLVKDVTDFFLGDARRKGVTLQAEIAPGNLMVEGEEGKIAIVLSNLIKNALTFTDSGGHIAVAAEAVPGYVKVTVVDDGIGIPAADLPRVFDRFYQVESHLTRRHGGMGLGLSVAKAMVEMHGGRISVESAEGKGSAFTVLLPVNRSQASAAEKVFQA